MVGEDGSYNFDPKKLQWAHRQCLEKTLEFLDQGFDVSVANSIIFQGIKVQSFKEFIEESFNAAPAKWKLIKDSEIDSIYRFTIDNSTYTVFFKIPMRPNKPVEVDFGVMDPSTHEMSFVMSGTGNPYKVLMTVLDTIKDFIARRDPSGIMFSARKKVTDTSQDSKSRAAVYGRMAQKFLPKGWSLTTKDTGHIIYFIMTKNQPT